MQRRNNKMVGKRINVAIVDDERHSVEMLKSLLKEKEGIRVLAEITDPMTAAEEILKKKPDLLFLDIQMPGKSGFDVLREISEAGFEPSVIFVTAYEKYAIEAIRHAAFDYILKPVEKLELYQALLRYSITYAHTGLAENYKQLLESDQVGNIIKLNTSSGYRNFHLDDIIYIVADYHFTQVYTGKDQYHTVIMNIGSIGQRLPEESFMRINRNTIIHLKYLTGLKRLSRKCILQKDGYQYEFRIPVNRLPVMEDLLK